MNYLTRGKWEPPNLWPEVWVVWGPHVNLVSEMKALLRRAESVTCGECQNWAAIHPCGGEAGHAPHVRSEETEV